SLYAVPREIRENPAAEDTLLKLIDIDREEFRRRLGRIRNNRWTPVRILRDVHFRTYAAIEERKVHMPGVLFLIEPKRAYRYRLAAHTLGHIGELKEEEANRYEDLEAGDVVGLAGVEKTWNDALMGKKGYNYMEVDAHGRTVGPLPNADPIPPQPGSDLLLTLDLELQQYCEDLMHEKVGSIVAIEPATGEVLAIVSKPDYPPETFANVLSTEEWRTLQEDPDTPLLHRAVMGAYPPGSIFKMAVLAAGLQTNTVTLRSKVTCEGGYLLGNRWFNCWLKSGHGEVTHQGAIESSCDVYFYLLGREMGVDAFHEQISRFRFGQRTGIDLPTESAGLLPDRDYFNRRYGKNWTDGLLFNIAIGQGEVLTTPLQAAAYTAALANGGWWYEPHLVHKVHHIDGREEQPEYAVRHDAGFDADIMEVVREDMLRVTEGAIGTAAWLYDPRIHVPGKTGTAQTPHGDDHAWFVAFAPYEEPEIAVAVLVEHGEHGSTAAAPLAFKTIRKWLGLDEGWWRAYRAKVLMEIQRQRAEADSIAAADPELGGQVE
ncbi:penicillin-binding protein 2, partial [bacterium]|nr:penicillin-binding protein 2 [bacterium]